MSDSVVIQDFQSCQLFPYRSQVSEDKGLLNDDLVTRMIFMANYVTSKSFILAPLLFFTFWDEWFPGYSNINNGDRLPGMVTNDYIRSARHILVFRSFVVMMVSTSMKIVFISPTVPIISPLARKAGCRV